MHIKACRGGTPHHAIMPPSTTAPQGLSQAEAAQRLQRDGPNRLVHQSRRTLIKLALDVVREPMFLLLLAAGLVYGLMGDLHDALVLLGFVLIIMGVTLLQERRTDQVLDRLRDLSSPRALVVRGGERQRIAGTDVVVGDIVWLAEGDRVPADVRLIERHELAVDESLLTGESLPVETFEAGDAVHAGTLVVRGQACGEVIAIGSRTRLGRIGRDLAGLDPGSSPLQAEVARLTARLGVLGVVLSSVLMVVFLLLDQGWQQAVLGGITLAMGILPQEFPVMMIILLALGARRLARHQVLTRRLSALETLGAATVFCVDKTGTLTFNRMQLVHPPLSNPEALDVLRVARLASEIEPHDPMEVAIVAAATQAGLALPPGWRLVREYELSPALPAMTHVGTSGQLPGRLQAAVKGAPEAVTTLCRLSDSGRDEILTQAAELAARGWRVLGVASCQPDASQPLPDTQQEFGWQWQGLIALADPLRPQVPEALRRFHQAGIRVCMITGDHPATARQIAHEAGIEASEVLTGAQIEAMHDTALADRLRQVQVFARVTPEQKLRLVRALQVDGEVVAMTGDGVNDAPALRAAHIGVAMGQRGTDVAREAASLVLLDDDFSTLVHAVRQGRSLFDNLQRALVYTLAIHVPIILLSMLPVLLGMPVLLAPLHIAFLELVIDPACSLVFEAGRPSDDIMRRKPRASRAPLLPASAARQALLAGLLLGAASLLLYVLLASQGATVEQARSAAFLSLVLGNAVLLLHLAGQAGAGRRRWLPPSGWWVIGGSLAVMGLLLAWPPARRAFDFALPSLNQLGWVAGATLLTGLLLWALSARERSAAAC